MTDTPTASPEAREVSRKAYVTAGKLYVALDDMTGVEGVKAIARGLDAYAARLREELEALRADCVIKVANARLATLKEAAKYHDDHAASVMNENHVGSSNDERRENRRIAEWHRRAADDIRALAQEGGNG